MEEKRVLGLEGRCSIQLSYGRHLSITNGLKALVDLPIGYSWENELPGCQEPRAEKRSTPMLCVHKPSKINSHE